MKTTGEKKLASDQVSRKKRTTNVTTLLKEEPVSGLFHSEEEKEEQNIFSLIQAVRAGVHFNLFQEFAADVPFSQAEWSQFLHLSEKTLQRYKKEESTFDPLQSERILEIIHLFKKGITVFGDKENFNTWLTTSNVALGNIKPKDLLDSSFGIHLLQDELIRIEFGVFA
ncbi:type II RES/Xre toxin-antitoxin system antitoxin [Adhaeribacter radiodurans]|uniref:DUF2384 domain-containing protein n=1 Tax=Adhaeribacter radiodurans TaxID=2745197 RepID=A0A7L7L5H7_9BACT|nr:antitoxin Xre-like helix-turn-helix domain-containing protein [Adhaeribacter radiodurans]QMU28062.1 DUF2384 domain-containing protein [Adhaeribacter radiodurans]